MRLFKKHILVITLSGLVFLCLGLSTVALAQNESLNDLADRAQKAGIEQESVENLRKKAMDRGLNEQQLSDVLTSAVNLAEEDLPANHLIQKALEGLSKGVPHGQMGPYINSMANATREAAGVVDPWMEKPNVKQMIAAKGGAEYGKEMRNKMVENSSRAITQNISSESVEGILSDIGEESVLSKTTPENIVSAMGILPDLPVTDKPKLTRSFMTRALKGGFGAEELQKLPVALSMAQKRSNVAAANIMQGASDQLQNGVPANDVLKNLFNGNIGGGPPGNIPKGMENAPDRGNNSNNSGNNN